MKSSPPDRVATTPVKALPTSTRAPFFKRIRSYLRELWQDVFGPLPDAKSLSFVQRIKTRGTLLYKKYGWKLLVAFILYYIIRDVTIYIVIPYLIARKLIGG